MTRNNYHEGFLIIPMNDNTKAYDLLISILEDSGIKYTQLTKQEYEETHNKTIGEIMPDISKEEYEN